MTTLEREVLQDAREHLRLEVVKEKCWEHPAYLLSEVSGVDATTGEEFGFTGMIDPTDGWAFQRKILDDALEYQRTLWLKARQLGATWVLGAGLPLWYLLFKPGAGVLIYSQGEDEAKEVIKRVWMLYESVPDVLRDHVVVTVPDRAVEPSELIKVRHPDGRISWVRSLPATKKAGRSYTAGLTIFDEFAYQEYARQIWTSNQPVISRGGKAIVISTGNGVSDSRGEGNFFHFLYTKAEEHNVKAFFLPWDLHPERDEEWYNREAAALPDRERAQEYPRNPNEAFILTGDIWYDRAALEFYRTEGGREPNYRARFITDSPRRAKLQKGTHAPIYVYEHPSPEALYAIGCDTSTGRGTDYSSADVIDLSSGAVVCSIWGKLDSDTLAEQLYFVGRWYNSARICVERGGGYGEAVIANLRDGARGRPPYPKLYRHRSRTRSNATQLDEYGFPMAPANRMMPLNALGELVRDRVFPWLSKDHIFELGTFVTHDTKPTPRAQDGTNDDRVISLALASYMYKLFGSLPTKTTYCKKCGGSQFDRDNRCLSCGTQRKTHTYTPSYPWQ